MHLKHTLGAAVLRFAVLMAAPVSAQSVVDPTTAEFDPSPDQNTLINGVPMLDHYELEIFQGQTAPLRTLNLGKPAPASDGKIRVNFASLLVPPLTPGLIYTADVVAVGPGGRAASPVSIDSFSYTAPPVCTYAVSPTSRNLIAAGASDAVTVTAAAGCAWTATETATWLTISSGATGSGNGTISFTATANPTTSVRSTTMTVAGIAVNITQAGACGYSLSTTSQIAAGGGGGAVNVTAGTGCTWTATETVNWLTISSGATGSGNGTVNYSVSANAATTSRNTTMTVAGQAVTITQSGAACTYVVAPMNPNVGAGSSNNSLTVTTTTGCDWTATTGGANWVTITSGASGSGSGVVSYSVVTNPSGTRSTTLTVAGATVTLTQASAVPVAPGNLHLVP